MKDGIGGRMQNIDKEHILTINNDDYIVIETIIKDNKKYLFLKGIDEEENLLDSQLIVRLVKNESGEFGVEDIEDRLLMETLRNEFANRLRKEYI